jgi:hypothetical protein
MLPDSVLSPQSQSAATRLLAALPDPRGAAELEFTAEDGVGLLRLMMLGAREQKSNTLGDDLAGLALDVSYHP